MSWQDIIKTNIEEWKSLSEVLLGDFDFDRWKDTPIPEDLKSMKKDFDSLSDSNAKGAVKKLLEAGMAASEKERIGIFQLIQIVLKGA
jgi:hypothetical protein